MQSYNNPIHRCFGTIRHKCLCKSRNRNRNKCYSNWFDKSIDIHPDIRPHSHSNSILLLHSSAPLWKEQA